VTDTPVTFPPSKADQVKAFVGDLARPFAVISTSAAAAAATVLIALRVTSYAEGAIFIGAVYAGVGALYAAKSWELNTQAKQAAGVEIAKAAAPPATDPGAS
jgi:hypothetical protein